MTKANCWEFRNCGRQPGGENVGDLGLCAAATTQIMDGIHGGDKAGRACWMVVGSLCGNNTAGIQEKQKLACISCDFYNLVKEQEGKNIKNAEELFNLVK